MCTMDKATKIHLKKNLNVTDLSGEKVMIDFESGKYFIIKGTGNDIWELIQEDITVGDVVSKLMLEYDVSDDECTSAVISFLDKMKSFDFIDAV